MQAQSAESNNNTNPKTNPNHSQRIFCLKFYFYSFPHLRIRALHTFYQQALNSNCLALISWVTTSPPATFSVQFRFSTVVKIHSARFSSGIQTESLHQCPSNINFLVLQIFTENMIFIHYHLICSLLAVVCSGATTSVETLQVFSTHIRLFTNNYQSVEPLLTNINNQPVLTRFWNIIGVCF